MTSFTGGRRDLVADYTGDADVGGVVGGRAGRRRRRTDRGDDGEEDDAAARAGVPANFEDSGR
jgi:hypothetical protein